MTAADAARGSPPRRVAVVVVHGVADQQPGTTSRALVDLLVASPPRGVAYAAHGSENITLAVEPLAPTPSAPPPRVDATPLGEKRPARKAFLQSLRSDVWRANWEAPNRLREAWRHRGRGAQRAAAADAGLVRTNYLLAKHRDNGAPPEAYNTSRIALTREEAGAPSTHLDVYEMYWADLSRLSGALPRIVTELFTMIFRLSKLGSETMDEARAWLAGKKGPAPRAHHAVACELTAALQAALDWIFVYGLSLLFLQLVLLTAFIGAMGAALSVEDPITLHRVVSFAVMFAGLLWFGYRCRDKDTTRPNPRRARRPATMLAPLALVLAGGIPSFLWPMGRPWLTAAAALVLLIAANEAGLKVADDRFPFVRHVGRWLWLTVVAIVLASAGAESGWAASPEPVRLLQAWMHGALFGTEVVLLSLKWFWVGTGVLLALWFASGVVGSFKGDYETRASIATGRLGLSLSMVTFLIIFMALWAMLRSVLDLAVTGIAYRPCLFPMPQQPDVAAFEAPTNACLWTSAEAREVHWLDDLGALPTAACYLGMRYAHSTAVFAPLALVMLMLLAYLIAMFVPSVLAEMKLLAVHARGAFDRTVEDRRKKSQPQPLVDPWRDIRARRLGLWLTTGYRGLDWCVLLVVFSGVAIAAFVALLFAASAEFTPPLHAQAIVRRFLGISNEYGPWVINASQRFLEPFVFGAASIAAALTVLGGLLSRFLPPLRAPLDIVLDVDNYFREFPRSNIPRARIFSRFAALLAHVRAGGYERIVIVAHSQGSVISAELLRFLRSNGEHEPPPGSLPRIGNAELPPLSLLTLGCPLRQLYAARFPTLYPWILRPNRLVSGPLASDIGVERWANAYCSGDYVGRWLWSDKPGTEDAIGHPMADRVTDRIFGRADAYGEFHPMPPQAPELDSQRELESCLSVGAHTHYFETDQKTVAWFVDHLVKSPPLHQQQPGDRAQDGGAAAAATRWRATRAAAAVAAIAWLVRALCRSETKGRSRAP